jgi:GxxExxY protein
MRDHLNHLSHLIIGIAIDIHKKLGPGFQEKIYEEALLKEFEKAEIGFGRHVHLKTRRDWRGGRDTV